MALVPLLLGVVAVLAASGCGSAVAFEDVSPVTVVEAAQHDESTAVPEPEPHWEHEESWPAEAPSDPADGTLTTTTAPPPHTEVPSSPPATPTSSKSRSERCDWHANLELAKTGRDIDWIVLDTGAWGRAEVPGDRVWIAPRTPCDKVYSVAVHEWTHHMQGVVYGDWNVVLRELAPYGGPEVVADCGALQLGATWIKYGCSAQESRDAAAAILRGERA